jgi:hypothetical protein
MQVVTGCVLAGGMLMPHMALTEDCCGGKLLSWSHQWGNVSFVEEANENPDASFDPGWCEPGKEL